MTKHNAVPVLLVMILLILVTTQTVPSAAGSESPQSETHAIRLENDSGTATHSGDEPASPSNQPTTVMSSGGGGLHLIK